MSIGSGTTFLPLTLQSCLQNVGTALQRGDTAGAMKLAAQGVARGFAHPQLLTLAAHERLAAGMLRDALELAQKARALAPRDPDVLNALGQTQIAVGLNEQAVRTFDAVLRQSPNMATFRFQRALALENIGRVAAARADFERVLTIQPNHSEALARIAHIAAQTGDLAGARDFGNRALKFDPRQAIANLALARADLEDKKYAQTIARASLVIRDPAVHPVSRSIAQGLAADAYDGLGDHDNAFAAYEASNATRKAWFKPACEADGLETASARAERLIGYFETANADDWRVSADAPIYKPGAKSPLTTHVFLVGFPRSGTTLMEQVLASHGSIEAMDEYDCLNNAFEEFILAPDGLDRLSKMSGDDLDPWRETYWSQAATGGFAPKRAVFVDKMPLSSVLLPLIAKLFPRAKILFALRDPRDVVFSCFRRRFGMSSHLYELLTLDGGARYYDQVMNLAARFRDLLGLDTHVFRYEDIVADFDGEVQSLLAFLGVDWDDKVREFAARAQSRTGNTPSASQVHRGLYTGGAGQWQSYAKHLAPVMPVLEPWIERYGYRN